MHHIQMAMGRSCYCVWEDGLGEVGGSSQFDASPATMCRRQEQMGCNDALVLWGRSPDASSKNGDGWFMVN